MAKTLTLLTIMEWAELIGLNPFYLYQIGDNVPDNAVGDCDHVFYEYPYQLSNFLSREDVRVAIAQAEEMIASFIGYYPAPKFIENEPGHYPRYYDRRFYGGMRLVNGQFKAIPLKHGYIQSVGRKVLTLITDDVTISFSDSDNDGVNDRFTLAVTVPSGTLAGEIALFNTANDRNDNDLDEYEIRPIKTSVSGTTATITGFIGLLVKPNLQERLAPEQLDADDMMIYVSDLEVYRRTINTEYPGRFIYESYCGNPGNCEVATREFCVYARDNELGIVAPKVNICLFDRFEPDRYEISYYAGYPRKADGRMNNDFARNVALLATALLPNRVCGCQRADQRLAFYADLPTLENGNLEYSQGIMEETSKVFGSMGRGAVMAYVALRNKVQFKGTVPQP